MISFKLIACRIKLEILKHICAIVSQKSLDIHHYS